MSPNEEDVPAEAYDRQHGAYETPKLPEVPGTGAPPAPKSPFKLETPKE